jgi:hypothetical protein
MGELMEVSGKKEYLYETHYKNRLLDSVEKAGTFKLYCWNPARYVSQNTVNKQDTSTRSGSDATEAAVNHSAMEGEGGRMKCITTLSPASSLLLNTEN